MAKKGQHDVAISYSKKVIFEHSRNWKLQRELLEALSKSGVKLSNVITLINEIALEQISPKTYEKLFRAASLD